MPRPAHRLPLLALALGALSLASCAPSAGRTNAGTQQQLPAAPAGPLIDSRLAFGLRYPDGTVTPGTSAERDALLDRALAGTRHTCIAGRYEHATLKGADAYAVLDDRLRSIGYSISPVAPNTYLVSRDFDVFALHADGDAVSFCETRW